MYILDSWGKTKEFFERKNFSMFTLVTLKAIKTTYGQIIKYFTLPVLIMICIEIMHQKRAMSICHTLAMYLFIVTNAILVHLALRPSLLRKNWRYYVSYWKHNIFLLLSPIWIFFGILIFYFGALIGWEWGSHRWHLIVLVFVLIAVLIAYISFTIFFFLDSRATCKAFVKAHTLAAKMLVYNLPVCVIATSIAAIVWLLWTIAGGYLYYALMMKLRNLKFLVDIVFLVDTIIFLLFVPIIVSILSNMYIKFLHEQSDVYFDQPK
jgi:5-bromo-4-chloroindolyl phosphate hydrolysis protein